jgi:hypothetical protein
MFLTGADSYARQGEKFEVQPSQTNTRFSKREKTIMKSRRLVPRSAIAEPTPAVSRKAVA